MPNVNLVRDIKPNVKLVNDIKPLNFSPGKYQIGNFTTITRTIGAGQSMGLLLSLTYPLGTTMSITTAS